MENYGELPCIFQKGGVVLKKIRLLSLLLLLVVLTGCLSPRIDVAIKPNPIVVTADQESLTGLKLEFKMRGFSLGYTLQEVLVTVTDHEGEERISKTFDLDNKKIPIIPGASHKENLEPISLGEIGELAPEVYDEVLKGKEWTLKIVVVGTKDSPAKAKIKFE